VLVVIDIRSGKVCVLSSWNSKLKLGDSALSMLTATLRAAQIRSRDIKLVIRNGLCRVVYFYFSNRRLKFKICQLK